MGWCIHRVWSTEWFYDREAAMEGIIRSVEQAEAFSDRHRINAPPVEHPVTPAEP